MLLAHTGEARQSYQAKIPNGANVPNHPSVGHVALNGNGERNAFGLAFKAAGLTWTTALCQADSDGDGQSNGLELGDPQCVWTEGATPARTTDISDPSLSTSTSPPVTPPAPTPATPPPTPATPPPTTATPATPEPTPAPTGGASGAVSISAYITMVVAALLSAF